MKKFKVIIPCTVYHTYEVEAESEAEAEEVVYSTGAEPIHTEYTGEGLGAIVEEIKE
jgi:hypothetical protein